MIETRHVYEGISRRECGKNSRAFIQYLQTRHVPESLTIYGFQLVELQIPALDKGLESLAQC